MFERFIDRGWRVLVLAQDEARRLDQPFIGTQHILLGLLHEGDGLAAQALTSLGVSLEAARQKVQAMPGQVEPESPGSPPFSPRAKQLLELSLREMTRLGHEGIDTEHLLLGLARQGESEAVEVLASLGVDLDQVHLRILSVMSDPDYVPSHDGAGATKPAIAPDQERADPAAPSGRRRPVCPGVLVILRPNPSECSLGDQCAARGFEGTALLDAHGSVQTVTRHASDVKDAIARARRRRRRGSVPQDR